jgi:(1->4)-alpha-D-glucan 1-alpha-D-glucosylmutase
VVTSTSRAAPVSTYRLQLHAGFGFAAARDIVSYLARLGITDCYSSPHLMATPGSLHGYDICDHNRLNPDLGSDAEYEAWTDALGAHGLGHLVDIVPNHMTADPDANGWWRDVLENGPSSPFSAYFDVDWTPIKPELRHRVLLPILGDQYGAVLERGELQLRVASGTLVLQYGARTLPLNPRQLPRVLGLDASVVGRELAAGSPESLEYLSILTALANLPPTTERDPARVDERHREKEIARQRLARLVDDSPAVAAHLDACVRVVNGTAGDPASFDRLHDLLEHQAYRLAYWRTAFDEINYRRFFDVNELIALRMEDARVFQAAHGLLERLVAAGRITGFRVDHPDGLFDPAAYLDRLQALARRARPGGDDGSPFYVVVEKILSGGEQLRPDWATAGTTGYAFLNTVCGLFIDGRHAQRLRRVYARLAGQQPAFDQVAYQCKRVITLTSMASELSVLAHALNRLSEADRRHRDFTLDSCRKALREVIACLPIYRTYVSERGVDASDRQAVEAAIAEALRRNPLMERSIVEFLSGILLPDAVAETPRDHDRLRFAMKLQQFSGPVQAKGVEDTAFYRYHALIAANDVGGHPARLGVTPAEFHEASQVRLTRWPYELNATATHDTKRGEDARVRLAVISEMPDEWRRAVSEWMRVNGRHRTRLGGAWAPDRNDEYLFYQALAGAWPAELPAEPMPQAVAEELTDRVDGYMQKAVREAKVHTSWIDRDLGYARAVSDFVRRTLAGRQAGRFLASFVPVARRLAAAGASNSLAQLVLKLASPGVADFYQGTEFWDMSLVDPDNRRPVDFAARQTALDAMEPLLKAAHEGAPRLADIDRLAGRWTDGQVKLLVTAAGLRFRRDHPTLLQQGGYTPLDADGVLAAHIVAFARHDDSGTLVAVVPRLVLPLIHAGRLPCGDAWGDTALVLPRSLGGAGYRHVFTGETVRATPTESGARISVAEAFAHLSVALLWAPPPPGAGAELPAASWDNVGHSS